MNETIDLTDPEVLFALNGGRTASTRGFAAVGPSPVVRDFGWKPTPPAARAALAGQAFTDEPDPDHPTIEGDKVFLWEFVKLANKGAFCPFDWQLTGSCVNGGFYNAFRVLQAVQCVYKPEAAAFVAPFTLAVYGQSRFDAYRDEGEGEGSSGLAMAKAATALGVLPADDAAAPPAHVCGPAIAYDRAVELKWSSVRNHPPGLAERSRPYNLRFTRVTTADQATAELRKGRPLTWAGDWGGQLRAERRGDRVPVLVMPRVETWNHQQSVIGYWNHPELGELWYVLNQWYSPGPDMEVEYIRTPNGVMLNRIVRDGTAVPVHGESLQGEPPGGYWITRADMEYQCRTGEVCSLHGLHGFDKRKVNVTEV